MNWNSGCISRRATASDIDAYAQYAWDKASMCANPNLDYAFFKRTMIDPAEVRHINWALLSANPSIGTLDIIENPHQPWNDMFLSANPRMTSGFITHEGAGRHWFAPHVSANAGILERDILKSTLAPIVEWDYWNLSANPNLPTVFVDSNLQRDWNLYSISSRATLLDVERFKKIPWDAEGLSISPHMTWEYVAAHPDIAWNYITLITSGAITLDDISADEQKIRSHIRGERLEALLSSNKTINEEWIEDNLDRVDWERLSSNQMR